ncbi:MAG TPA: hypothetical protein VKZ60_07260 [Chloroflexota bacterium]|jgi:hypothetical protein|nr:hypothetical protein [Chloroflexota bacterium]
MANWWRWSLALTAGLVLALGVLAAPTPVLAHERRAVGEYTFIVGFLKEPAFEGETNGIDLRVVRTADEQPVEGLEQTLKAEVIVGPNTMPVPLRPRFRQPGAYNGEFVPTRPGSYTFHFTGTVNGLPINETFESGPGRFDDVQAVAPLQFPDKVPAGIDLQRALVAAESRASTALALGLAGLLAGVAGLAVALWALASRRPPAEARVAVVEPPRPAAPERL